MPARPRSRKLTLADASPGIQRIFWGNFSGEGGLLYYTEACMDINSRVLSVGRGLREETDRISCIKRLVGKSCVKRLNAIKRLRETLEDQELAFQAMQDSIKATETTSSALNSFISEITHGIQCARASLELLMERVSEKATNPEVVAGLESSSSEFGSVAVEEARAFFIRHSVERECFKKLQAEGLHQTEGGVPGERGDALRPSRQVSGVEEEGVTLHTVHSLKTRVSSIIHAPGYRSDNLRDANKQRYELSADEFDDDLASPDPRAIPPLPKPNRRRLFDELPPPPRRRAPQPVFGSATSDTRPEGSTMSAHDVIEGLTSQLSLTVPGDTPSAADHRPSKRMKRRKRGEDPETASITSLDYYRRRNSDDVDTGSIKRFIQTRTKRPSGEVSDALSRFIESRSAPRPQETAPSNCCPLGPLRTGRSSSFGHPKSTPARPDPETSSLSRFVQSRSSRRRQEDDTSSLSRFLQSRSKRRKPRDADDASGSIARFIQSRKKRPDADEVSQASGSIARFIQSRTGQQEQEGEPAIEAASATLAAFARQQEKAMSDSGWGMPMSQEKLAKEAARLQARMEQPLEVSSILGSTTTSRASRYKRNRKKKKRRTSWATADGVLPVPSPARTAAPARSRWRLSKSAARRNELIRKFCEDFSVPGPARQQTPGRPPRAAKPPAVFHCPFTELDIAIQVDKDEDFLKF